MNIHIVYSNSIKDSFKRHVTLENVDASRIATLSQQGGAKVLEAWLRVQLQNKVRSDSVRLIDFNFA